MLWRSTRKLLYTYTQAWRQNGTAMEDLLWSESELDRALFTPVWWYSPTRDGRAARAFVRETYFSEILGQDDAAQGADKRGGHHTKLIACDTKVHSPL